MDTMTTVSEVLNHLKSTGYIIDFNLEENALVSPENSLKIHPDEFVVDKHYRFEGMSDPSDEAIVYAISSVKHNIKGTLVNGYGISSDEITSDMINALKEKSPLIHTDPEEKKSNDSTPLRPQGQRDLDAQMVTMDLQELKEQIRAEESYKNGDRNAITIFKNDDMRIVLVALHKGAEMKTHTAPGVISVQVLEGHITFTTDHKTADRSSGQMLALHAGVLHSVQAIEESVFLLTLCSKTSAKL